MGGVPAPDGRLRELSRSARGARCRDVPDAPAGSVVLARVPEAICVACHGKAIGRPAAFPQVDLARHYAGASCLWCHNPHDATAVRPPTFRIRLTGCPRA